MIKAVNPPPNWGEDGLSEFLEIAHQNSFSAFVNFKTEYSCLQGIDEIYKKITDNMNRPKDPAAAFFLSMARSSFLGAVRLSTSGQLKETSMVLRGCLEDSLYGFYIHKNPASWETWLRRHDNDESKKSVKSEFKIGDMMTLLEQTASHIGKNARLLYERTIDFGAHPNERALFQNVTIGESAGSRCYEVDVLTNDPLKRSNCLKMNMDVGICSLFIFSLIFKERFKLLGLDEQLSKIAAG